MTLAAAILRAGGLLRFGQMHLQGTRAAEPAQDAGPQTLFEKILTAPCTEHVATPVTPSAPQPGQGGFVRADWRFIHEYYTGMAAHMLHRSWAGPWLLHQPQSIVVFEDHTSYVDESPAHVRGGLLPNVRAMCQAQRDFVAAYGLREHRTLTDAEAALDDGSNLAGISHAMMAEHYALPGQVVVGTDSHTPHSGALGCVAFGVGTTDMANALVTGAVRITMPECLRVELNGAATGAHRQRRCAAPAGPARDPPGCGCGQGVRVCGAGGGRAIHRRARHADQHDRRAGGPDRHRAPDAETVRFLRERRGVDFVLSPGCTATRVPAMPPAWRWTAPHSAPWWPRRATRAMVLPLDTLNAPVKIDIAYGGSCTAGKREDFDHYHAVLAWGLARGLRVPAHVQLFLQYGTTAVRDYCIAKGYDKTFAAVGARILQPSAAVPAPTAARARPPAQPK
jgi:3-isopropylmalate/(R)-2-methylmalate dehydratase large subunit